MAVLQLCGKPRTVPRQYTLSKPIQKRPYKKHRVDWLIVKLDFYVHVNQDAPFRGRS